MELSIFLAKLLGIYFLIIAADLLLRKRELESAIKDFAASKGLLVCSGSFSIFLGLAIVIAHPVYETNWRGFITLLGYLIILRGIRRVAFPTHFQKNLVSLLRKRYWALFFIMLVFGVYLTYSGFTAH